MRTYVRRYVAALLAITIATGFIVAINALSSAARTGAGEAVAQQYDRADLAIYDLGDAKAYATAATRAAETPGVDAVATNWEAYGDVGFPDGPQNISIGSIATAPSLRWQEPVKGRLPDASGEVALSSERAKEHGVAIGDRLTLKTPAGDRQLTVTGTVDDHEGPLKSTAYIPETEITELGDMAFPRDIVMTTSGDAATAKAALKSAVDGTVSTGTAYQRELRLSATQGIDIFQILITVFAGISLFVGALVIANTFTILLAQRARDLALLRCVGAMRAQVARSVVAEGVLIGVIGAALGVAVGYLVALLGVALTRNLSPETPMGDPSLTLKGVAIPVLLGVLVTAAAAVPPGSARECPVTPGRPPPAGRRRASIEGRGAATRARWTVPRRRWRRARGGTVRIAARRTGRRDALVRRRPPPDTRARARCDPRARTRRAPARPGRAAGAHELAAQPTAYGGNLHRPAHRRHPDHLGRRRRVVHLEQGQHLAGPQPPD